MKKAKRSAGLIGAGLAGLLFARALKASAAEVTLVDESGRNGA